MKISEMVKIGFVFSVVLITLSRCYYDEVLPVQPNVEVGEMSFAADIIPIFNKSCNGSGCHNGSVKPNLLPANAYNELFSGGYINKSSPADSKLYKWMIGEMGTPMPPSGTNAIYNAKVLAWIEQGALNN
jgi:hypothetical protein